MAPAVVTMGDGSSWIWTCVGVLGVLAPPGVPATVHPNLFILGHDRINEIQIIVHIKFLKTLCRWTFLAEPGHRVLVDLARSETLSDL
jgi:hypothetical protein